MRNLLLLVLSGMLSACGGDSGGTGDTGTSGSTTGTTIDTSGLDLFNVWLINTSGETSSRIRNDDGSYVDVNVQSVTATSVGGVVYARVEASGIPNYVVTLTQDQIDALNARPKASTDFVGGVTSASAGDVIAFGDSIAFNNTACPANEGRGYWPPGPGCPENLSKQGLFTSAPQATAGTCESGGGAIGYAINGASIFNWTDAQSYKNQGVWETLAPLAEAYDADICGGHAANGEYHHHAYSSCWASVAGDDASGHSPIYGYAADGYAVYGPWQAAGTRAQSCWAVRDYDAISATGCGVDGARTCLLADPYDPDAGTVAASADGPTVTGTYISLSGNVFTASAGFFFQDYYFDSSCAGSSDAALDQYNGHSDSERGYHYHLTTNADGANAFPFSVGPRFAGALPANAITSCGGIGGGGGGGGGPPPPG